MSLPMQPTPPPKLLNEKDGSTLVLIPAGEFLMGSEAGFPTERPVHEVFLEAFYLSTCPVTTRSINNLSPRPAIGCRTWMITVCKPITGTRKSGRTHRDVRSILLR